MQKYTFLPLLALVALLMGCNESRIYMNNLDGDWIIEKSERWEIFADGSVNKFEDLEDAGTLSIYEPTPSSQTLKEFTFNYTNFAGGVATFNSLMKSDEDKRRIFFSQVLCGSPFECDIVWTVDVNRRGKQVWSAYGNETTFFYPADRYNASDDGAHLKWTITLRRD